MAYRADMTVYVLYTILSSSLIYKIFCCELLYFRHIEQNYSCMIFSARKKIRFHFVHIANKTYKT